MVLEDYGELMFLQTVLKKIGFDVDGIQNPRIFSDSVLTMNPDVVVMTAHGKRVKGLDLSRGLRRVRGLPHTVLIRAAGSAVEADHSVAGWLESPVTAANLLDMIADVAGLNKQVLQEKLSKFSLKEIEEEKIRTLKTNMPPEAVMEKVAGHGGNFGGGATESTLKSSTMPANERQDRYAKFLKEAPPKEHGFAVKEVAEQVRNLRKLEATTDLADLERERKAFVEHLFNKKKA